MSVDIVLDLETMGKSDNAAIIEIGAVAIYHESLELVPVGRGGVFNTIISLESSVASGGEVDADTIMWWMKQSDEARLRLVTPNAVPHHTALFQFSEWVYGLGPISGMWGNGAVFDNVILKNAFKREKIPVPWTYKADRCYRTLRAEMPGVEPDEFVGVYHSGVDDARNEARHLIKILKEMRA